MVSAELRFSEFASSWQTKKLEDVSKVTSGGTPSRTNTSYWNGDIPWITTSLIDFSNITYAEEFITEDGLKNSSAKLFKKGTLLVALYGQGVTRGKVATLRIDAATNQACAAIMLDETKLQSEFVFYSLQAKYETIRNLANDGGQKNLSGGLIKSIPISFPKLEEQKKIADFLSAVDEKIRLLKEKHALVKQYKKGVMQKLFNQEIRFKDDNGQAFPDWSDTPVGEFMAESKVLGSKGDRAKKLTVKLWGKGVFAKDKGQKGSENTQYYVRSSGQFIYSKLDFLNCAFGIVPEELDGYESTVDLPCFNVDPAINKYFILEYIKQKRFYKKFGEMADGSRKAKRIHAKDFLSFVVELPSEREQQKIAEFLEALDKKSDAVQQQIDLTQTFKKGLLQQMFV